MCSSLVTASILRDHWGNGGSPEVSSMNVLHTCTMSTTTVHLMFSLIRLCRLVRITNTLDVKDTLGLHPMGSLFTLGSPGKETNGPNHNRVFANIRSTITGLGTNNMPAPINITIYYSRNMPMKSESKKRNSNAAGGAAAINAVNPLTSSLTANPALMSMLLNSMNSGAAGADGKAPAAASGSQEDVWRVKFLCVMLREGC